MMRCVYAVACHVYLLLNLLGLDRRVYDRYQDACTLLSIPLVNEDVHIIFNTKSSMLRLPCL